MNTIKKPISVLLAFAIAVIPLSCKSLDPKLLEQTATFDKGVTPMRVVINTDSIKACFPGGWRDENEWRQRWEDLFSGKIKYDRNIHGVGSNIICCSFPEQEMGLTILKNNLLFESDSKNLYLSVIIRNVEWRQNRAWSSLGIFLIAFGFPIESDQLTIDLEAALIKPGGKVLKIYKSQGIDTEYAVPYWGYIRPCTPAFIKSLIAGCSDLRKQIEADKENINKLIR